MSPQMVMTAIRYPGPGSRQDRIHPIRPIRQRVQRILIRLDHTSMREAASQVRLQIGSYQSTRNVTIVRGISQSKVRLPGISLPSPYTTHSLTDQPASPLESPIPHHIARSSGAASPLCRTILTLCIQAPTHTHTHTRYAP